MADLDPILTEADGADGRAGSRLATRDRPLTPTELQEWLERHGDAMAERWMEEVRARGERARGPVADLLAEFLRLLVRLLPAGVGPHREHAGHLFREAAELYGSLGAARGLAAGEAVEEFQLLREVFLRYLFRAPLRVDGFAVGIAFRELLLLNRFVDLGVTHASIGHTDALFFKLLHGAGVAERLEGDTLDEVREQLRALAKEADQLAPATAPE